ncbi:AAA family ATPase [Pseudoponticoccus marisrubri]|uniref:Cell division protein ZipA n=1 Tax=Pseudoponticoccus marisrubri TaxID=1685382 RepID=A0A0W7WI88_9RHOB|nr:ATP-binding protein [Pseudoponticoccus marisrubri]KUF10322.1 cell division protein ZipA [Pseudoponticoccus marisrubri]
MTDGTPTLHILCGKIASGKSTLAALLGAAPATVTVAEDDWLSALYPDEMHELADYVRCSTRLRQVMAPHLAALLRAGLSVVLDFPANTPGQRNWMRGILADTGANHRLHLLDVPDDVCLARLQARNRSGAHPFLVSDAQFHAVTRHFVRPTAAEGFDIVIHTPAGFAAPAG